MLLPKCSSDCYFNGTEIVNNGKIDRPKLLAALKDHFVGADPGFGELHEKAIDHCIDYVEKKIASKPTDNKCDKAKTGLAFCLHRYYFKNCPSAAWVNCKLSSPFFLNHIWVLFQLTNAPPGKSSLLIALTHIMDIQRIKNAVNIIVLLYYDLCWFAESNIIKKLTH